MNLLKTRYTMHHSTWDQASQNCFIQEVCPLFWNFYLKTDRWKDYFLFVLRSDSSFHFRIFDTAFYEILSWITFIWVLKFITDCKQKHSVSKGKIFKQGLPFPLELIGKKVRLTSNNFWPASLFPICIYVMHSDGKCMELRQQLTNFKIAIQ